MELKIKTEQPLTLAKLLDFCRFLEEKLSERKNNSRKQAPFPRKKKESINHSKKHKD